MKKMIYNERTSCFFDRVKWIRIFLMQYMLLLAGTGSVLACLLYTSMKMQLQGTFLLWYEEAGRLISDMSLALKET